MRLALEETLFFLSDEDRLARLLKEPFQGMVRREAIREIQRICIVLNNNVHDRRYEPAMWSLLNRVRPLTTPEDYEPFLRQYLDYLVKTVKPRASELRRY